MSCRTGCPTQDHESWGDCARASNIQIDKHGLQHRDAEKQKDKRLDQYASLRKHGIQPRSTKLRDIRHAEQTGGVTPRPDMYVGD